MTKDRQKSDAEIVKLAREYLQQASSAPHLVDWLIAKGLVRHDGSKGCIITDDGAVFAELVLKQASNPTCH